MDLRRRALATRRRAARALAALVLLGACGSSAGQAVRVISSAGPTTTTSTTTTTTTTVAPTTSEAPPTTDPSADPLDTSTTEAPATPEQAAARAALLTIDDFDTNWDTDTSSGDPLLGPLGEDSMRTCLGRRDAALGTGTTNVASDEFYRDDVTIDSAVALYDTKDAAHGDAALFASAKFVTCARTIVADAVTAGSQSLPKGTKFGPVTVAPFVVAKVGDASSGLRLSVVLTQSNGDRITEYTDIVVASKGRAELILVAGGTSQPVERIVTDRLLRLMVDRIPATL
jgi:hypothetical protein